MLFMIKLLSRKVLLFTCFALIFLLSYSCGTPKRLVRKADKHFENGMYAAAGDYYRKAYSKISFKEKEFRADVAFKQGESYRLIGFSRAEQVFMNAIRNQYNDSIVYLKMAQAFHRNGKYKNAIEQYKIFLSSNADNKIAISGLQGALMADSIIEHPTRHNVSREKPFNVARSSSFSPAFADDEGNMLVFTSNRKINSKEKPLKPSLITAQPNNSLFLMKKNSKGIWEKAELIEGDINSKNDEGVASFSSNGQTMYYTRSITEDAKGDGTQIIIANRSEGTWSNPTTITLFNDSTISVAHPALSPIDNMLYFVSDAPGGEGGKDIWRAKIEGGKAEFVENLGNKINTPGDEMFPSFKADGTLYFSSNGHPGLGGLDIFEAKLVVNEDNKSEDWIITHMGSPINSNGDDFSMSFSGNTNSGYFSSNRNEMRGYDALYSFELPELTYFLEGIILAKSGENVPNARINIVGNDGTSARVTAKRDGSYRFKLNTNTRYLLQATGTNYLNISDTISTYHVSKRESETYYRNFNLSPNFASTRLDNIYYDFDKTTLRPESKEGLDELINILEENPHITIELSSHTDFKGNNEYNRVLSAGRAQSVVDYLIKSGIDGRRLTAIGYGEELPFVVDLRTAKEYSFLEQGVKLTEAYILNLEDHEQEIANQINRRTEFKVLSTDFY